MATNPINLKDSSVPTIYGISDEYFSVASDVQLAALYAPYCCSTSYTSETVQAANMQHLYNGYTPAWKSSTWNSLPTASVPGTHSAAHAQVDFNTSAGVYARWGIGPTLGGTRGGQWNKSADIQAPTKVYQNWYGSAGVPGDFFIGDGFFVKYQIVTGTIIEGGGWVNENQYQPLDTANLWLVLYGNADNVALDAETYIDITIATSTGGANANTRRFYWRVYSTG